jgi:predicted nucleic acid-binding protein
LIIAAAEKAGCTLLLSEDLAAGRSIGKIKIKNPFEAAGIV